IDKHNLPALWHDMLSYHAIGSEVKVTARCTNLLRDRHQQTDDPAFVCCNRTLASARGEESY
ncbi:hypothetical protein ABG768_010674, partial [Culter alburnus]